MLPREGFYVDPLAKLLRWTLFNQLLTLPAWALLYSSRYVLASEPTEKATLGIVSTLMTFLLVLSSYGLWLSFNTYMTVGLLNNWVGDDSWDWGKEIVVVTGGSSGIGASIVQQLVDRNPGTSVVVVDYSPLTYAVPAGSKLHYYQADLSMIDAIRKVCATIRTEVGHPSVLINNAGLLRGRTVMEGTYSDVEITIKTNLIAPFLLAKEFLPSMVKKNHGHIVGISSLSAIISPAFLADYAATKAGMLALQETLRQELRYCHHAPKVRVSTAVLSFIQTPMFKGRIKLPHFLLPLIHVDTVGEAICDVLYSGHSQTLWLPGIVRFFAFIRGASEWIGEAQRIRSQRLGVDYTGRQNIDPKTGALVD